MGGCRSDSKYVTPVILLYNFTKKKHKGEQNMILVPREPVSFRNSIKHCVSLRSSTAGLRDSSAVLIAVLLSDGL